MNLGEFRKLTSSLSDDVELIIEANANPFGNCWTVLFVEATQVSAFGQKRPAIKLSESIAYWASEGVESGSGFLINPKLGQWAIEATRDPDLDQEN